MEIHTHPDTVYFNMKLLITYLSKIKTLICRREMSLIGSTSFVSMHTFLCEVLYPSTN